MDRRREGRLKFDQWSNQNGQKRSKHGAIVDVMQMLDSKKDGEKMTREDRNDAVVSGLDDMDEIPF